MGPWREHMYPLDRRAWPHEPGSVGVGTLLPPHPYCRYPPTLLMSMVSKASCRRRSLRSRLLSEEEATPPLPVLPPGLCWKSMVKAWKLQGHTETWRNKRATDSEQHTFMQQAGLPLPSMFQIGFHLTLRVNVDWWRSNQPKTLG